MDRVIRLRIVGRGADTDAPTVDDLLDQLRDYFGVLREVERARADDGVNAIDWRVVSASTNSPIEFVVAAFPREYATNIDDRVGMTVETAARGLQILQERADDPPFFTERAVESAERFFGRVMNGLSRTNVDHGNGLPALDVTSENARAAVRHAKEVLSPPGARPYREVGSLEGYVQRVEKDGFGRPVLRIRVRLTGRVVKCFVSGLAREKIEKHEIAEVWSGRRIRVVGTLHYKSLGHVSHVDASDVRFFRAASELPRLQDIEDTEFTGGRRSEEYIELIRNGDLN
jgi:hypothetical protein